MLSTLLAKLAIGLLPIFNIERGCQMDTAAALEDKQDDKDAYGACIHDEEAAKAKVTAEWSRYPASSRATCSAGQTDEYIGSYVELMTCLEIQDWKKDLGDIGGVRGNATGTVSDPLQTPIQTGGHPARNPLGAIPELIVP